MYLLRAVLMGKAHRAESTLPACFLVRFAGAPNPGDTTTTLFLLTVFQLLLTGRHDGKEREKKKPQANISFLSTDCTYVGYSGAAGV